MASGTDDDDDDDYDDDDDDVRTQVKIVSKVSCIEFSEKVCKCSGI